MTSLLFTTAIFATYSLSGHVLTASTLFTSLALFNTLIAPLNSLPWVINGVVEALVSVDRLEVFLGLLQVTWRCSGPTAHVSALHAWPNQAYYNSCPEAAYLSLQGASGGVHPVPEQVLLPSSIITFATVEPPGCDGTWSVSNCGATASCRQAVIVQQYRCGVRPSAGTVMRHSVRGTRCMQLPG